MVATTLPIILASGRQLEAQVRGRRGTKRITLRLDALSGRILVNGPLRLSKRDALGFITANTDWIEARLAAVPPPNPFQDGSTILFRGRPTLLVRKDGRGAPIYRDGDQPVLEIFSTAGRFATQVSAALKALAHNDALAYSDCLSARLGKAPRKLALRDTRSRWGSCTSAGDIMVSWRLIGAPPRVFEYVVAHELAHLFEMNHSPRFWAHVTDLMPDWRASRDWLKAHGKLLHALGR